MGLSEIRIKNKRTTLLLAQKIDYSFISKEDVNKIKTETFEILIEPLSNKIISDNTRK